MQVSKETSTLMDFFGDTPKTRVLEFLIAFRNIDHSIGDIAKGAGINRITLFRMWSEFEKMNIVTHTRKIGNAKLFTLNLMNPYVRNITKMFDNIVGTKNKRK